MKNVSIPRFLIVGIIILIMGTSLMGSLHAFATAHAKTDPRTAARGVISLKIKAETTETAAPLITTPTPVPVTLPVPVPPSADTTGIIALAIMIVIIVLSGAAWGMRKLPDRKKRPR